MNRHSSVTSENHLRKGSLRQSWGVDKAMHLHRRQTWETLNEASSLVSIHHVKMSERSSGVTRRVQWGVSSSSRRDIAEGMRSYVYETILLCQMSIWVFFYSRTHHVCILPFSFYEFCHSCNEGQKSDTEMTKTVVYEQTNGRDERKFGSDLVKSQFKDI